MWVARGERVEVSSREVTAVAAPRVVGLGTSGDESPFQVQASQGNPKQCFVGTAESRGEHLGKARQKARA